MTAVRLCSSLLHHCAELRLGYSELAFNACEFIALPRFCKCSNRLALVPLVAAMRFSSTATRLIVPSASLESASLKPATSPVSLTVNRLLTVIETRIKYSQAQTRKSQCCDINMRHDIIELLLKLKIPEDQITELLPRAPDALLMAPIRDWDEAVVLLKSNQFNPTQLLQVLTACPGLVVDKSGLEWKALSHVFTWLRSCGFGEGKMQAIVSENAKILNCSLPVAKKTYENLLEIFKKSEVDLLLMNCPIVLTIPWSDTAAKLEYVFDQMGVTTKHVVKSQLLKHSMAHIVTRHRFLERVGLYRKPNKHGVSAVENPSLKTIMDTTDKKFVMIVAGMEEADYAAFTDMMKIEMAGNDDAAVDSDQDDDSDLDDDDDDIDSDVSDSDDEAH